MTGLEIFLIAAGFMSLCISFFVAQRTTPETQQQENGQTSAVWTEKEEQMIRQRVDEILYDRQTEVVESTEEQMNRLCNDKIMAIDEFSGQLLEKIESNHHEVVFMYNMLNEKKKEITDIVTTIQVREPEKSPEEKVEKPPEQIQRESKPVSQRKEVREEKVPKEPESRKEQTPTPKTALELFSSQGEQEEMSKEVRKLQTRQPLEPVREQDQMSSIPGNVNLQIQKMHKEGKSVLEISKELNIGQGEVKLVIALYGGRNS